MNTRDRNREEVSVEPLDNQRPSTVVAILNWNGLSLLEKFLPTAVENSGGARVVVIDNGSTDESVRYIQSAHPDVEVVELGFNYGFAEGYNRGLQQIDCEFYCLLNSDVEVTASWLTPLIEHLAAHPEVAAVQPKILDYRDQTRFEYAGAGGGYLDPFGYPVCRGRVFDVIEEDHGQYDDTVAVDWTSGAAMVIRSNDFWAAGGFDTSFHHNMEEVDLCWRLRNRGRSLAYCGASYVYHLGRGSEQHGEERRTRTARAFINCRNSLLMLANNTTRPRLAALVFARVWIDIVAAVVASHKQGRGHLRGVAQAYVAFAVALPGRASATVGPNTPTYLRRSAVVQYVLLGRRLFAQFQ